MIRKSVVVLGALVCLREAALAQNDLRRLRPSEAHDQLVASIKKLATRSLPQGDTLVTWNPEPVLFHTVSVERGLVRSGLLRADGMTGTAETRWTKDRLTSFHARWTTGDSVECVADGRAIRDSMFVTGSRDTSVALSQRPLGGR